MPGVRRASPSDRPNILFFFTDEHRLSALGCCGETPCETPNIDRLADEGVRFETAYTCCPVCTPARASIMTGLYPHAHGMTANLRELGAGTSELPDSPHLLSRRLEAAGYRRGYTGKWHLGEGDTLYGAPIDKALPSTRGFEGIDFPGHGGGGFHFPEYKTYLEQHGWTHALKPMKTPGNVCMPCGLLAGPVESTVPYFLAEHTIALIDRFKETGEPFFIWHSNWGPHEPYYVPEAHYERYRAKDIPPWPNYGWPARDIDGPHQVKLHTRAAELTWNDWADAIRYYYAFATLIDEQIGRVLDHLEKSGLADNTVVVFSSDHGETLGSHGGLIDKGWQHFEEIQRIGLIVKDPRGFGPNGLAPGSVPPQWASILDLHPTFLDLARAGYDAERLHGRSLLPVLRGEKTDWRDDMLVEFHGLGAAATLITYRHGDLKYGWNVVTRDELYDLAADPHEMRNVIADPAYAAAVRDMRERLDAALDRIKHSARGDFGRSRLGKPTWRT
ncbi:MAG: sulfatase-like hydrolase/transferase [Verrucomicrobia bacterium]|nr:sulfatase-like hydrolase/transferase [Verrucomicrobiota bacterium]